MKLAIVALALVAAAVAVSASSSVMYTRTSTPDDWSRSHRALADESVSFTLALKQRNLDILDKWFWEVSDPKHANYQQFKSVDEIRDLVSPKKSDVKKVKAWLAAAGVHTHHNIKDFGDAIEVDTTVKHAEQLFGTKFYRYTHGRTGARVVRQFGAYSVPSNIRHLIDMVAGISTFPVPHLIVNRNLTAPVSNDYGVVPQTIDQLYQISQSSRKLYGKAQARVRQHNGKMATVPTQSVVEFQGQNFANSDLTAFGQGLGLNIPQLPAGQIVGPNDQTNPQTEATLDIEMIASVDLTASNWFWLESGNGWLYQFGVHFFSTPVVPMINSISYGWWEADQCTIDPTGCSQIGVDSVHYTARVNTEFQKIGTRGISLVAASGDSGANGRTDQGCTAPTLRPSFPASSPYITAVGATELVDVTMLTNSPALCGSAGYTCAASGTEQAVSYAISGFASGGGFSALMPQPSYQAEAVAKYLQSGVQLPPSSFFNATGRGFPDVGAIGHNLLVVQGGAAQPVGGTSASAPIFTAVMSLVNVAQIAKTGKPLGFLNPFLYQMWAANPKTFHHVTVGDNKCTEDGCSSTCNGYLCAPGWDPVTGLGTPNLEAMLAYVRGD